MTKRWSGLLTLILSGAIVIGCGTGTRTAGIDRSGLPIVVHGPITGFGSIILNDVHYELSSAQINVNGSPVTEMDLAVGQIVTVSGTIESDRTTGTAESVVFEANVQGPVQSVDLVAGRLVVLGQDVIVGPDTVFEVGDEPAELGSIVVNDLVQVSGFVSAEERISATRIERRLELSEWRVIGTVDDLDAAALRFEINDLIVDYSNAQMINGFPTGEPTNGDAVRVRGSIFGSGGELLADDLEFRQREIEGEEGDETEIEGLITRFVSPTDFDVSGFPVTTTPATDYEGGTEANLILNVKIEVEGDLDSSGVIVADKIEIKDGGQIQSN